MNGNAIISVAALLYGLCSASAVAQRVFSDQMLRNPKTHHAQFEQLLSLDEVPVFEQKETPGRVLLENGYAEYRFANPDAWPPQGIKVQPTAVKVIFTKYPRDKEFWLTDYHWLLSKRLQELFKLDSSLNAATIDYSMLLQTDCSNEFETMQLFHGIEITYVPLEQNTTKATQPKTGNPETGNETESRVQKAASTAENRNTSSIKKIRQLMVREHYSMDSTVFKVLDRQQDWKKSLVVLDWTGSMYGYGAEALLWQAINQDSSHIEAFAFFNDGDRKKDKLKMLGYTGGIYVEKANPVSGPVRLMQKVQNRGKGGDSPENDIEALVTASDKTPGAQDIVLVADNQSCIRDFVLLSCLNRPVHIILCGTDKGINHQYLNLAWRTGGSIHTKDLDLENIHDLVTRDSLVIQGIKYTVTADNHLMPVERSQNSFHYCDRYYKTPKKRSQRSRAAEPKCYFTE